MNPELPKIKQAGEDLVVKWLTDNGYSNIEKEALLLNEYGLKATGNVERILVQVRSFQLPNRIFKISDYESDILARRAAKLEMVAYVAYVMLDEKGALAEDIRWERLG